MVASTDDDMVNTIVSIEENSEGIHNYDDPVKIDDNSFVKLENQKDSHPDLLKPKNLGGRPTHYSEELGSRICHEIATTTKSIQKICDENEDFPASKKSIFEWRLKHKGFGDLYTRARQERAEIFVEELLDIADNPSPDWGRDRLRIDTRKWIACKMIPKTYGDKIDHNHDITIRQEDALKELE